ncbi:MAG: 6-phospho-beta-galactosidase [Atopobiaceae bacterium]|jgi:6-phospho-beta-galactosidase|nr:6-phospho-beta-galactosidase [Atopobiaceae bacterium]MCI2174193.1 6-phospho-beta-galactosidase [Atopobiaceae bacterium]MCI2206834.1 6-phospho-beta-galactosidase [Atopobiaceae bacterium]
MRFPDDFIFGGATAAYQAEGATKEDGKGRVPWDSFLEEQGRFSPDPACDFYHLYPEDLKLAHDFHLNGIRLSIAWSRIFPTGAGAVEPRGVRFYHEMFAECQKQGVEPFVTLNHFDPPEAVQNDDGWLNPENVRKFEDYARFCFEEFPEIRYWITINEPTSMSGQQYISGTFPPGEKNNFFKAFQAEHAMNLAHARAVNAYKEMGLPGEIGVVHALQTVYPYDPDDAGDQHAAALLDALEDRFYLDGTLEGSYSDETLSLVSEILEANDSPMIDITDDEVAILTKAADQMDFVGVNYYFSKFEKEYHGPSEVIHNGTGAKGSSVCRLQGVGEERMRDGIETTDWDWAIYPQGLYDQLMRIKRDYPKAGKVYITENGIGLKESLPADGSMIRDQKRIDYVSLHMAEVLRAIESGVDVRGYFIWSLQDMFSWTNGYSKRYGLFFVDFETQERHPKQSAYWFKRMIDTKEIPPTKEES